MKKYLPIITFVVIVVAIVVIGIVVNNGQKNSQSATTASSASNPSQSTTSTASGQATTSQDNSDIDPVALAKFLTQQGAIFYGAYWCPHCQDQKKLFGDAMQYINYVECDPKGENAQPDKCTAAGVDGYPTWVINGQKTSGTKTLSELAQLSGFKK